MMRSRVFLLLVLVLIAGVFTVVAIQRAPQRASTTDAKPSVAASFYPLAEFARQVGGDHVAVTQITPTGVDAHDFQLSPQNLIAIQSAKVFLYNGGGLEPWAERIHKETEEHSVIVINALRALGLDAETADTHEEAGKEQKESEKAGEDERGHAAGGINPHIWLDPVLVQRQVEIIRDALVEADPAHAGDYRANADRYLGELRALDAAFRDGLASCTRRDLIIPHDSFRYLAKRYGLTVISLAGLSPEQEARPRQLTDAARRARAAGIRTVFAEVLVSSRLAETFAREIGAEVRTLHPLEGLTAEELREGKNYLSLMRDNLRQLQAGLECR